MKDAFSDSEPILSDLLLNDSALVEGHCRFGITSNANGYCAKMQRSHRSTHLHQTMIHHELTRGRCRCAFRFDGKRHFTHVSTPVLALEPCSLYNDSRIGPCHQLRTHSQTVPESHQSPHLQQSHTSDYSAHTEPLLYVSHSMRPKSAPESVNLSLSRRNPRSAYLE